MGSVVRVKWPGTMAGCVIGFIYFIRHGMGLVNSKNKRKPRWTIPINRTAIPKLTYVAPRRRRTRREKSLEIRRLNSDDSMPTWADFRDYLLKGPRA